MSRFIEQTLFDIRTGRESWRVISFLSAAAFAAAVVVRLVV
jgi:hypothetical protein